MSYPGDFLGNSKARKKSNTKKKSSRKSFTKFQQTETLANQDYKCNECKIPFKKSVHPHFDHIDGNNSNNALENCQALCANCHDNKSRHENVKRSIEKKDQNFVKVLR